MRSFIKKSDRRFYEKTFCVVYTPLCFISENIYICIKKEIKMQFLKFKQQFDNYIVFSTKEIEKMYPAFNRMNLIAWQKKG